MIPSKLLVVDVSTIAAQMLDDLNTLHLKTGNLGAIFANPSELASDQIIGDVIRGQLALVLSRRQTLCDLFRMRLAIHSAVTLNQAVFILSSAENAIRITRKLADVLADIPSEEAIYDGRLDEPSQQRLKVALMQLSNARIKVALHRLPQIETICAALRESDIALVLITLSRLDDVGARLSGIRQMAEELQIPIIAFYPLDDAIEGHATTLTKLELRRIEMLALLADRISILSEEDDSLIIRSAKVPTK